jgi:hypothetical protein
VASVLLASVGLDILRFSIFEKLPDDSHAQLQLKWSSAGADFSWLGSLGIMDVNPALQAITFEVGLCRCCCIFHFATSAEGCARRLSQPLRRAVMASRAPPIIARHRSWHPNTTFACSAAPVARVHSWIGIACSVSGWLVNEEISPSATDFSPGGAPETMDVWQRN